MRSMVEGYAAPAPSVSLRSLPPPHAGEELRAQRARVTVLPGPTVVT